MAMNCSIAFGSLVREIAKKTRTGNAQRTVKGMIKDGPTVLRIALKYFILNLLPISPPSGVVCFTFNFSIILLNESWGAPGRLSEN